MNHDTLGHALAAQVAAYADGSLPESDAWPLERHLESCGACAASVSEAVRASGTAPRLADVRAAVLAEVTGRAAGTAAAPVPYAAPRATATPAPPLSRLARLLWAVGPAVRGAWLLGVLSAAVGAAGLWYGGGVPGARALLLAVAPVVPVAGVALSYGAHADPLHEITASTPSGGLRLALVRTVAVLAVSIPLLTGTGLLLPASGAPAAAAWLLPALALSLATLALASFTGCRTAGAVTGGGWLLAVTAPVPLTSGENGPATRLAEQLARCLDGPGTQGAWATAAALSAVVLTLRRTAYDRPLRR
ncbi:zf-HC2 domain-containing protein [Streptomyces sp. J2-1]|uniref:zf-HC2 domain-containing protein n=1 Tax=Streptomyces corallincola TaxID=2851888 RepID=UPI001C391665|nr:zf-HC2 domain-containing protein [Streptomyces corallincola]MBV2356515.1 zf-HC2 domain-containing protein [Streptomyces corallincola]